MKVTALFRLVRLPNVFTAIADIAMGFLFVHGTLRPAWAFSILLAISTSLYMAGMVLNDLYDRRIDAEQRPTRPIPSGAVSPQLALRFGIGLLALGLVLAALIAVIDGSTGWLRCRPMTIAICLTVAIWLYDGPLKRTPLAPVAMGACRALNILLGMSYAEKLSIEQPEPGLLLGFDPSQLVVAGGIGTYVAGITVFASDEAIGRHRLRLVVGTIIMVVGLAMLASFPDFEPFRSGDRKLMLRYDFLWPLTVALLGVSLLRRCILAATSPTPHSIQVAVRQCILSLIVFDAAVTMAVTPGLLWPITVLSLLVPFVLLGQWIEST